MHFMDLLDIFHYLGLYTRSKWEVQYDTILQMKIYMLINPWWRHDANLEGSFIRF